MIFLLLFQLIFQKEQITNSFVTKCSANNYHLAIDNATPISTREFNTAYRDWEEMEVLNQRTAEPREERVEVKGNVTIVDRRRKFE